MTDLLTYDTLNESTLTPMMRQYLAEKKKWPDCLLFFRMGDFYELFFDDALTASEVLQLTLTKRDAGVDGKAPMCGVPHHAATNYVHRLVQRGYKVAVCDQMEDPALAKGLVKREVTRIVTPGTVLDPDALDEQKNNYIAAIYQEGIQFGLAACDLASGHFETTTLPIENGQWRLRDEITRLAPHELIVNRAFVDGGALDAWLDTHALPLTIYDDERFSDAALTAEPRLHAKPVEPWTRAASALLHYLDETQQATASHIADIAPYTLNTYMLLDSTARLNLELVETIRERSRKGSLLATIDRTKTSMGSRLLRRWLLQPLIDPRDIMARQSMVARFVDDYLVRQNLRHDLSGLFDIERLVSRIALGRITPRDMLALAQVLATIPAIKTTLATLPEASFRTLGEQLVALPELSTWLLAALVDEPPMLVGDAPLIRAGFDSELDHLKDALTKGKQWLLDLEARERETTGIKNMRVGYNRVFGYYLEVSKSNLALVPAHYIRKQTLANAERYFTEALKDLEATVLGAESKVLERERFWFNEMKARIAAHTAEIQSTANALAMLDVYLGLAELADKDRYVKPEINDDGVIIVHGGRHPVVERQRRETEFVPNDAILNDSDHQFVLLTGPNMAGKSTYMRQNALIVILAQIGSFVPAESARIGVVDRIFTRVGASDDVASGQSTYMVEMTEVAAICRQATAKSLVILDEVGRGTSTFDGLAMAWAIIEYIADPQVLGCRTMFATHYHELTELEGAIAGLTNYHVAVTEENGEIVFLHRIRKGGTDDSYGIDVAKLAGVPASIVARARELLIQLERDNKGRKMKIKRQAKQLDGQLDLFSSMESVKRVDVLLDELATLNVDELRPLDALTLLADLSRRAKEKQLYPSRRAEEPSDD